MKRIYSVTVNDQFTYAIQYADDLILNDINGKPIVDGNGVPHVIDAGTDVIGLTEQQAEIDGLVKEQADIQTKIDAINAKIASATTFQTQLNAQTNATPI